MPKKPCGALPPLRSIGANIRAARTSAGLTQLALAHAMGHTGPDAGAYISRIESGAQSPRLDTLNAIAGALGVPLSELLPVPEKPKKAKKG